MRHMLASSYTAGSPYCRASPSALGSLAWQGWSAPGAEARMALAWEPGNTAWRLLNGSTAVTLGILSGAPARESNAARSDRAGILTSRVYQRQVCDRFCIGGMANLDQESANRRRLYRLWRSIDFTAGQAKMSRHSRSIS